MPTIYHRQNDKFRVIQRGKLHFVQQCVGITPGDRDRDPWEDIARGQDCQSSAISLMYSRQPEVLKQAG
jgi:hypothetical protein